MGGLADLVARHQVAAVRVAYLLVQDRAQAEDIVQDSFLRVLRASGRFRLDSPFVPWFHRIVVNEARQRQRATRRRREVLLDHVLPLDAPASTRCAVKELVEVDPADHAERAEVREALLDALRQLPLKQREVLVLRYYAGYKDSELAAILDSPAGTIRWRLHAGLRALEYVIRTKHSWLLAIEDEASQSLNVESEHVK